MKTHNVLKKDILFSDLTNNQMGLWYLGQEGFIIKFDDSFIAIDPYLSDYVDKNCSQFVKWERLYPAPIKGSECDFLQLVLCTHTHYDHADPWTLPEIAKVNPTVRFVIPAPEVETLVGYGIERTRIIPAYADQTFKIGDFSITPIPSAHETFHTDEQGNYKELGYIIECGSTRIFHAGDMCMYDGLIERLKEIDIAILPINGRDYFRNKNDIIGNFDEVEAITLAQEVSAKLLIPVHHDLYEVNRVNPANFVDAIMRINRKQRYHVFVEGEKYIYQK